MRVVREGVVFTGDEGIEADGVGDGREVSGVGDGREVSGVGDGREVSGVGASWVSCGEVKGGGMGPVGEANWEAGVVHCPHRMYTYGFGVVLLIGIYLRRKVQEASVLGVLVVDEGVSLPDYEVGG